MPILVAVWIGVYLERVPARRELRHGQQRCSQVAVSGRISERILSYREIHPSTSSMTRFPIRRTGGAGTARGLSVMPAMTINETEDFLAEPGRLLRVGTVDPSGMPSVVPIWFIHEDGRLLFTPRARSGWLAHLRFNPNICCTIDEADPPMRKFVAKGRIQVLHDLGEDDAWRDEYRRITMRYVPESFGDAYLDDTTDEPRVLLALPLANASITTWRMPFGHGENPLNVWAKRYYHDGR